MPDPLHRIFSVSGGAILRLLLPLFLFVATLAPSTLFASHHIAQKNILILHSFYNGHVWNDSIVKGIEAGFEKSDEMGLKLKLFNEYMDAERFDHPDQLERLSEFLKAKYRDTPMDLIIATDDSAFRILLDQRRDLFPKTPVVFCGVNYFEEFEMFGNDRFTGVVERIDIVETVNTALALHPETESIVVVVDQSDTSIATIKTFVKHFQEMKDPSIFRFIPAMTMARLEEELGGLPPRSLVLYVNFTTDVDGQSFTTQESLRHLSRASNSPIYSFWDNTLGFGVMGGMMASGSAQGRKAADMALQILSGTGVSEIPVFEESLNHRFFDHNQMQRFGVRQDALPDDAEVINVPFSFYATYKELVWSIVGSIAGLGAIILILVFNTFKRKRVEVLLTYHSDLLTTLHAIDRSVLDGSFSHETMETVMAYVRKIYDASWGCLVEFDTQRHEARVLATSTAWGTARTQGSLYPLGVFQLETLSKGHRFTVALPDALNNTLYADHFHTESQGNGYVSVPLLVRDELKGALLLSRFPTPGFTIENLDIVREVAASLAVAIESTNLTRATRLHGKELERLSAKVFEMQEATSRRISFELHDEIGQSLTAATLNLAAMKRGLASGCDEMIGSLLSDTEGIVDQLSEQAHDLSLNLWPPMLRDFGLNATLTWYLGRLEEKVGLELVLCAKELERRPSEEIETTVYRLAQEALNNVVKHASASRVEVHLEGQCGEVLRFRVKDNGLGFSPDEVGDETEIKENLGLLGMRERVAFLGGHLTIRSAPGAGTEVDAVIPWR